MVPGEIYLAYFPFGGRVGNKLRPVLLLTGRIGSIPEILVAFMTSIMPPARLPTDMVIDPAQADYASTNLKKPSLLRLHKLATVHESDIARQVGELPPTAWGEVQVKLRLLLNL